MNTKIYLIRHSETIGNVEKRLTGKKDFLITKKGMDYINKLNNKLSDIKFDAVYSSVSNRSIETIKTIAKINELPIIKLEQLMEMDFGDYDGWKWEDVNRIDDSIQKKQQEINVIEGIPNQESMEEVAIRMYNCIIDICENNLGKTIIIASHGVAIEAFLRKVTKVNWSEKRKEYAQHNASINIVNYDHEIKKFNIELLNEFKYLMELEYIKPNTMGEEEQEI